MGIDLVPARVTPPGRVIRRELDARGWTQKDLAEITGRPEQAISQIVRGHKQITPETALQLAAAGRIRCAALVDQAAEQPQPCSRGFERTLDRQLDLCLEWRSAGHSLRDGQQYADAFSGLASRAAFPFSAADGIIRIWKHERDAVETQIIGCCTYRLPPGLKIVGLPKTKLGILEDPLLAFVVAR